MTIYQVSEDRGVPFLAMELLEGESLESRLNREGKLPLAEVLRIGCEIAEGLAAAHVRGLIHRDIKPANIWLESGPGGKVKILDFGLARPMEGDAVITDSGDILGTPAYMAPEQARGERLDHRADLFSLGCVLYRLATGQMPFPGAGPSAVLFALATRTPAPPRSLDSQLPSSLERLILELLAKAPDGRPGSAVPWYSVCAKSNNNRRHRMSSLPRIARFGRVDGWPWLPRRCSCYLPGPGLPPNSPSQRVTACSSST